MHHHTSLLLGWVTTGSVCWQLVTATHHELSTGCRRQDTTDNGVFPLDGGHQRNRSNTAALLVLLCRLQLNIESAVRRDDPVSTGGSLKPRPRRRVSVPTLLAHVDDL